MANSVVRRIGDYKNFLIAFLVPLLFLPLPIIVNTSEARCGYVVLVMGLYWCTECIPLAATGLLPVILFPIMGIMKSEQVCLQYLGDANIMGAGGLMVAIAVEYWNLHKRFALGMLMLVGARPALLMMGFMAITAFISMWITNVASTAMMLPIVHSVLKHLKEAEAQEHELQRSRARQTIHSTDDTALSPVVNKLNSEDLLSDEQRRVMHEEKYSKLTKGMSLSVCYAASIGGTSTLNASIPNLILKGQIDKLFPENKDVINYTSWFLFSFPNMVLMLVTSWLWLQFLYLGFNVKNTFGCRKTSRSEQQVYQTMKSEYRKLCRMSFAECAVLVLFLLLVLLWFTREPGFSTGWASLLFNQERKFVTDATVSIFICLLFFIIPSKLEFSCWNTGSLDITGRRKWKAPPTLLQWELVQKKMPWNIMLLLGGSFALARGCEVSKLSLMFAQTLEPLKNIPPVALSFLLCFIMAMLTELCHNAVISTMLLPVLASMATAVELHPLYIMLPPTISASFAFMLPVATPPNAITFSYAKLKIMDMVKPGLMLNLLGILCVNFAVHTWGTALFQLNEVPSWANVTTIPTTAP
ncbi:Na(+)/citrate cotransporter-like isoform X1 [Salminus brasiliensis]|uniref:Na(+)/citrate cotransporter-like isoform X1 n=1 Tax=Salminus brasiliensis TaxID=930266 RepID=UPI003B83692F